MYPVYGLAEACLAVAFPEPGTDYRWIRANRHKLGVGSASRSIPPMPREVIELMCVGQPLPNMELRIADDARAPLPDGRVGHILIRGPNVTQRLFRRPGGHGRGARCARDGSTPATLGVFHEGGLYITGRSKDIIFVNGQNYYPYDLENIAQRAPGWISTRW